MKRVIICSVILFIIVASAITMLIAIKNHNNELTQKIDVALSLWEDKKTQESLSVVNDISEYWEHYYIMMSFVITSDKMQSISMSVAKLKPLLLQNNNEFHSECESIKLALKLIYDSEIPHLHIIV